MKLHESWPFDGGKKRKEMKLYDPLNGGYKRTNGMKTSIEDEIPWQRQGRGETSYKLVAFIEKKDIVDCVFKGYRSTLDATNFLSQLIPNKE